MTTFPTSQTKENLTVDSEKAFVLEGVGKKYPFLKEFATAGKNTSDFWALQDVSFEVPKGQTLGVIGRNGAGKTTLLNIMAGVLTPTTGKVKVLGKVVSLFNLGVGFQDELTGRENIYLNAALLGAERKEIDSKFTKIVEFSELGEFIEMPLGSYSQGMRLRLAFSILTNLYFDILILDEVLAVGDILFQQRCYQRLADFKREKKTLIITTQSMEFIERFCDVVLLLDHGRLVCVGHPADCIQHYRNILATEKFFVGIKKSEGKIFCQTKKWTQDMEQWGNILGTQEAVVEKVSLLDHNGHCVNQLKSLDFLKIRVDFLAKNTLKMPHLGIAIFREDGVYVYGPNTSFDGIDIYEILPGKQWFELEFYSLELAPGKYRISVAVWDQNEHIAYTYHCGRYPFTIVGSNNNNSLTMLPYSVRQKNGFMFFWRRLRMIKPVDAPLNLEKMWGQAFDGQGVVFKDIKFFEERIGKEEFLTNRPLEMRVDFAIKQHRRYHLWLGIYREDRVLCQELMVEVIDFPVRLFFPRFSFLPGKYFVSCGIWDGNKLVSLSHGIIKLSMVFDRQDHGTLYLEHNWRFSWRR